LGRHLTIECICIIAMFSESQEYVGTGITINVINVTELSVIIFVCE